MGCKACCERGHSDGNPTGLLDRQFHALPNGEYCSEGLICCLQSRSFLPILFVSVCWGELEGLISYSIVESLGGNMAELVFNRNYESCTHCSLSNCKTYMSETIPLGTALRVHNIGVIVSHIRNNWFDIVLEDLTTKCRRSGHIERETDIIP